MSELHKVCHQDKKVITLSVDMGAQSDWMLSGAVASSEPALTW